MCIVSVEIVLDIYFWVSVEMGYKYTYTPYRLLCNVSVVLFKTQFQRRQKLKYYKKTSLLEWHLNSSQIVDFITVTLVLTNNQYVMYYALHSIYKINMSGELKRYHFINIAYYTVSYTLQQLVIVYWYVKQESHKTLRYSKRQREEK